jgi:hypothetical protein
MAYHTGPTIVTDGLVLCLDAADRNSYAGSGSTWYDLSGSGNDGTINGATFDGGNNGSFSFDSTDTVSFTGNIPSIGTGDFAIETWVRLPNVTATSCWRAILSIGNGFQTSGGVTLYAPRFTSPTNTAVAILNTINPTIGGITNINDNNWHHIVLTRTSSTLFLYVDAFLENSTVNTANITQTSLIIGRDVNCSTTYFHGYITNIKIYQNKGLFSDEVTQNYNATKGRFGL